MRFFSWRMVLRASGILAAANHWRLAWLSGTAGAPPYCWPPGMLPPMPDLAANCRTVADFKVPCHARLSAHDDVVTGLGGAGEADLRDEEVVLADLAAVADGHAVGELGASADDGAADGGTIDTAPRAHLNIIFDDGMAGLRDLVMRGGLAGQCMGRIAEAILPD